MEASIGGIWGIWLMEIMQYGGTDPNMQAAVDSFNFYFSVTFEFGIMAFMCTMVITLLARS